MVHPRSSLCLLLLAFVLGACQPCPDSEAGDGCKPQSGKIRRGEITSMNFEEFFLKHQSGDLLLVDARDLWFYNQGRIPGAISLPSGESLDDRVEALLPRFSECAGHGHPIVVYCNGFGCHDARTISRAIAAKGYDVRSFGGGWKAWKKCDLPIETTSKVGSDLPPQPAS